MPCIITSRCFIDSFRVRITCGNAGIRFPPFKQGQRLFEERLTNNELTWHKSTLRWLSLPSVTKGSIVCNSIVSLDVNDRLDRGCSFFLTASIAIASRTVTELSVLPTQSLTCSPLPIRCPESCAASDIQGFAVRARGSTQRRVAMKPTVTCHGIPRSAPEAEPAPK